MSTDLILRNAKIATNGMPSQVGAIAVSDGKQAGPGPNFNYWALWAGYEF